MNEEFVKMGITYVIGVLTLASQYFNLTPDLQKVFAFVGAALALALGTFFAREGFLTRRATKEEEKDKPV